MTTDEMSKRRNRHRSSHGASTVSASIAAVGSILVAWSCCLPVLPFTIAVGFAGSSAFLREMRPYLVAVSVLLIGYGFYESRRAKQCQQQPKPIVAVLLWASVGFVVMSIFLPQMMANFIASLTAR
jgi:hypothetical protein